MVLSILRSLPAKRLEIVAFVVGLIILTFEFTAARLVAPYLGATIYTWTSIIGVILAALAAGYALGGEWADRRKRLADIVLLLMAAASIIALITVFKDGLLSHFADTGWPLQLQALCASLLLFALPTVLLGAVLPYLARLSITDVSTSGRKLSRIDAASTVGSLVGTFLTGYILFGLIGTRHLLILLALGAVAASLLLDYKKYLSWRVGLILIIIILGFFAPRPQVTGFIQDVDTAYNRVLIRNVAYDNVPLRILQTGNDGIQSGVYADGRSALAFAYLRGFAYTSELQPEARHHLVIGGGAFTFPEFLAKNYPHSTVDTVEIDDRLAQVSKDYFYFRQSPNHRLVVADGRQFLNHSSTKYDMIFLDAFNSHVPPFQLLTTEAAGRMHDSLQTEGIAVVNVISASSGYRSGLIQHVYNTFRTRFPEVTVYKVTPDYLPTQPQNLLLVASKQPISPAALSKIADAHPEFGTMIEHPLPLDYDPQAILTDDYAPVELLAFPG